MLGNIISLIKRLAFYSFPSVSKVLQLLKTNVLGMGYTRLRLVYEAP